jgi:hypothetical protein
MIHPDTFVGSLAVCLAIATGYMALGPFRTPTKLRLVAMIRNRYGDIAARVFVALVASLLLVAGVMILRDFRPGFAAPLTGKSTDKSSGRYITSPQR